MRDRRRVRATVVDEDGLPGHVVPVDGHAFDLTHNLHPSEMHVPQRDVCAPATTSFLPLLYGFNPFPYPEPRRRSMMVKPSDGIVGVKN